MASAEAPSRVPPLVVDAQSLDFGSAWAQSEFKWPLRITNVSDEQVSVSGFGRSCQCTSAEPDSLAIPAHATREVTLTIDLAVSPMERESKFEVKVVAHGEPGAKLMVPCLIRGKVKRAFLFSPREIGYSGGDGLVHGGSRPTKVVDITPQVELLRVELRFDAWITEARIEPSTEAEGMYRLSVTPCESLAAGRFSTDVQLTAVLPSGESLPAVPVPVRGMLGPDALAFPGALTNFSRTRQGVLETPLILSSRTGAPFYVIDAQATQGRVEIAGVQPGEAVRHELTVRVTPEARGWISDRIVVTVASERSEPAGGNN